MFALHDNTLSKMYTVADWALSVRYLPCFFVIGMVVLLDNLSSVNFIYMCICLSCFLKLVLFSLNTALLHLQAINFLKTTILNKPIVMISKGMLIVICVISLQPFQQNSNVLSCSVYCMSEQAFFHGGDIYDTSFVDGAGQAVTSCTNI